MLNASASSVKAGDKVIVSQRIPSDVLKNSIKDGTSNTLAFQWGVGRGIVGRVVDTRVGEVHVDLFWGSETVNEFEFKDYDFEKYFAERL